MNKKTLFLNLIALIIFAITLSCEKNSEEHFDTVKGWSGLTDPDGNTYDTIKIGKQIWFVENLKTTKYNDGTEISYLPDDEEWQLSTKGAYCWYENKRNLENGALYNWYAIQNDKLCPDGWRVPSQDDWIQLKDYLANNKFNYDGSIGDAHMEYNKIGKSVASKISWEDSNNEGSPGYNQNDNNSSGFNAIPAGQRYDFTYNNINQFASFWSNTKHGGKHAFTASVFYSRTGLALNSASHLHFGHSVRLIKK